MKSTIQILAGGLLLSLPLFAEETAPVQAPAPTAVTQPEATELKNEIQEQNKKIKADRQQLKADRAKKHEMKKEARAAHKKAKAKAQ